MNIGVNYRSKFEILEPEHKSHRVGLSRFLPPFHCDITVSGIESKSNSARIPPAGLLEHLGLPECGRTDNYPGYPCQKISINVFKGPYAASDLDRDRYALS